MANFITSIQLPQADKKYLSKLQTAMKNASFITIGKAAGRISFHYEADDTIVNVISSVTRVIKSIGEDYSFTVIKDKRVRGQQQEQHT